MDYFTVNLSQLINEGRETRFDTSALIDFMTARYVNQSESRHQKILFLRAMQESLFDNAPFYTSKDVFNEIMGQVEGFRKEWAERGKEIWGTLTPEEEMAIIQEHIEYHERKVTANVFKTREHIRRLSKGERDLRKELAYRNADLQGLYDLSPIDFSQLTKITAQAIYQGKNLIFATSDRNLGRATHRLLQRLKQTDERVLCLEKIEPFLFGPAGVYWENGDMPLSDK